jgi:hypothetical protein
MMSLPRSGNFYFTLAILIFLVVLVGTALTYRRDAAFVPLVIGIPSGLLALLELVRDRSRTLSGILKTTSASEGGKGKESIRSTRQEIAAILIIIGYVALVMAVGFHLAILIYVVFYGFVFVRVSWWKTLTLAAATWGFIYLVFCVAMDMKFPWSFVF